MSYYAAMALAILLSAFAQVLLKRGAAPGASRRQNFLNRRTLAGYALFGVVTILNMYALQAVDLKTMSAWVSATYVLVMVLSWKVLKEKIDGLTVLGCALIVLGIIIFNAPARD